MSEVDAKRSPTEESAAAAAASAALPVGAATGVTPGEAPIPPERALRELACGGSVDQCELAESLAHIGATVETFAGQIGWLRQQPDHICTVYGPFLGRSILELVLTGLISRTDPFRVLVLREMQRKSKDDLGVKRKAAIQWQGDVLAKKKPSDLWSSDLVFEEISRALLSDYLDHVFWRSAFTRMADLPEHRGGAWLAKYRNTKPEDLLARLRSSVTRLYSSLSKGLHHEFVIPPEALYDRATVFALIQDVLDAASTLALATHMLGHVSFRLDLNRALESYERVQELQVL